MQENPNQGGFGSGESPIDFVRLIKALISKIWVMVLVGAVLASVGVFLAKSQYVETYASSATLAFMTTTLKSAKVINDEGELETFFSEETTFYTKKDVGTYQFLLTGSEMLEKISQGLNNEYSKGTIENSLKVKTAGNLTGFFVLSVENPDKSFCERAMEIVLAEFPEFVHSYNSTLSIKVVKEPTAPYVTNSDASSQNMMYGFAAGIIIVVIFVFISVLITDTVSNTEMLRNKTDTKLLGAVPVIEAPKKMLGLKKEKLGTPLITDEKKVSFSFVEAFKTIRTKIESFTADNDKKVFVVTSTYEDEGKTTVAINIACSLAQKGKAVLLIDCDLRKPAIMQAVGVKTDTNYGLIPIIKGTSTYIDSIKFIKSLGIFIMPSGGISLKSTEVLDNQVVRDVISKARQEFDYIIIDTPPANVVSDSMVVSSLADAIIYTIRKDYAKVKEINRTIEEIMATTDTEIIGSIFTMAGEEENSTYAKRSSRRRRSYNKRSGYGDYGYGYGGYGYGYGYEQSSSKTDDNEKKK